VYGNIILVVVLWKISRLHDGYSSERLISGVFVIQPGIIAGIEMEFIADLHIHSYLSRATAKNLNLEYIHVWAQLKGISVVGTGDFTHPLWFSELREKLEPAEEGLFKLKRDIAALREDMVPASCRMPVRFLLSVEISSIYKKGGKVRKVHNIVFAPDFETADRINQKLKRIGNLGSDGRPILGLDSKTLLEMILEVSEEAVLIPAHIWTPWFSILGSRSGFDSLEECFEDLTPYIFAIETGLSSDPGMNWRVSQLDGLTLVSNSDAHSPANLGREASLFNTSFSYAGIREALKSGDPERFLGTIEFFPEEGKYHFDGHRKCGVRFSPEETMLHKGICPVCGKPVTIGVMYRVEELADRMDGEKPKGAHPFISLLPLTDILGEVLRVGPKSKKVEELYQQLLKGIGPEFQILIKSPLEEIERNGSPILAEAIRRMRKHEVYITPGYDGEFGSVKIFAEHERDQFLGQRALFQVAFELTRKEHGPSSFDRSLRQEEYPEASAQYGVLASSDKNILSHEKGSRVIEGLNPVQKEAVEFIDGPLLIVAGPGTGKTRTIVHRIAFLIDQGISHPKEILAVTFTNKAAEEMKERLKGLCRSRRILDLVTIKTLHSLCFDIIRQEREALGIEDGISIVDERDRMGFIRDAIDKVGDGSLPAEFNTEIISNLISRAKQMLLSPEDDLAGLLSEPLTASFCSIYRTYEEILERNRLMDFEDLIFKTVLLLERDKRIGIKYQKRYSYISVDEFQDINYAQYRLILTLAPKDGNICAIGDPDQAIYGFRGADVQYFYRFQKDYPDAKVIRLERNYRSTETILKASAQVLRKKRVGGKGVHLWSGIHGERNVTVSELPTEKAEAEFVVKTIESILGGVSHFSLDSGRIDPTRERRGRGFSDFAVLYRINDQGRILEEAFFRSGIPYQRMEREKAFRLRGLAELISYLRSIWSIASDPDIERILNFPPRGIDKETIKALKAWAEENGYPLLTAIEQIALNHRLEETQKERVKRLLDDLAQLKISLQGKTILDQIHKILDYFEKSCNLNREGEFNENLKYLLKSAELYGKRINDFLAHLALQTDADLYEPRAEKVTLMTIHAAKGLEFPIVFITGCEDGLIPFRRSRDGETDILEERRLFYVGLTRAKEKIFLTHAKKRLYLGKRRIQTISPFLEDIEDDLKRFEKPFEGRCSRTSKQGAQLKLFES